MTRPLSRGRLIRSRPPLWGKWRSWPHDHDRESIGEGTEPEPREPTDQPGSDLPKEFTGDKPEPESDLESTVPADDELTSLADSEEKFELAPLPAHPKVVPYSRTTHDGMILREFPSFHEMITCAADDRLYAWSQYRHDRASHQHRESEWAGTATWDEALALAQRGWPEGRKLLSDSLTLILPKPEPFRSQVFDVAGQFPLVPLHVAGDPACMVDTQNENIATRPLIRIDYCNAATAKTTGETLMYRGAAVVSLARDLEYRGYSVELRVVYRGYPNIGTAPEFGAATVFKKAGEYLDLDRAAFAIAHPSILRRFIFALKEQHADIEHAYHRRMGSTNTKPIDPTALNVIHIPGPIKNQTLDEARRDVELIASTTLRSERKVA